MSLSEATLELVPEQRVGDFSAQRLSNTAWAFATASQREAALALAAGRRVGGFSAQCLANTAWAFATATRLRRRDFLFYVI